MAEENEILEEETENKDTSVDDETAVIIANREAFEKSVTNPDTLWGYSTKGLNAKKAAMTMLSTKTGMYASIPLICKAEECPYSETCKILEYDLAPYGEACPMETSKIELFGAGYANDVGYDESSFTDRRMVSDLVGYDIMLERCKALMTKEGTPVIDIVVNVTENGDEIKQPTVSKAWEAYEKISKKRNDTYQLLMMTRKDKRKDGADTAENISDVISSLISEGE